MASHISPRLSSFCCSLTRKVLNITQKPLQQHSRRAISATTLRHASQQSGGQQDPKDECHLNYLDGDRKGIAVISLRRFSSKNALGRNIIQLYWDHLNTVKFDPSLRCLIIRSEVPGFFCVGADLKERLTMTQKELAQMLDTARVHIFGTLQNLPVPTIAAIDGFALGGGFEMALCCDMRTIANTAKVGLTETRLAVIPGGGGTQRLTRLVGSSLAKELIFTARMFDGQQAKEYGVANYCVDQNEGGDAAYQRALKLADEIVPNGPVALRMAKNAINQGGEVDLETGLKIEQACYAQVIPTKDRIEGLKAFQEKRKPVYEGH